MKCKYCDRLGVRAKNTLCEAHYYQIRRNGKVTSLIISQYESHDGHGTPEYNAWRAMKARCNNPKNKRYKYYGGRGVKVCPRWEFFSNFIKDMGNKPSAKHSLDRKDTNGDYTPDNCKWSTSKEQSRNRRCVKLNVPLAKEIRKLKKSGVSSKDLGVKFNVRSETIDSVCRFSSWRD